MLSTTESSLIYTTDDVTEEMSTTLEPGNNKISDLSITILFYLIKLCSNKDDPCDADPYPCGTGSECSFIDEEVICTCPAGKSGDPNKRCCSGDGISFLILILLHCTVASHFLTFFLVGFLIFRMEK